MLEELARAMNSEISNTQTGRKAISKEQVRSDSNSKVTDVAEIFFGFVCLLMKKRGLITLALAQNVESELS